jgi:pimeloyl-ACP methyl ester carboxylesterase
MSFKAGTKRIPKVGEQLCYKKMGNGPPLILLHGLLGGSFCWRFNLQALSQHHTVYILDFPGLGEHVAPRHLDCSMAAQADRLISLLEELGFESVDVIGPSWGGAIAIFLAARSHRVRSLVLAAPVNPWSEFGAGRIRLLRSGVGSAFLRLLLPLSRPVHSIGVQRMYGDSRRVPVGTIEGYSAQILRRGRTHNILSGLRCWESDIAALREAISQIKAQTLLVWGTRDGAVDLRSAQALKQAIPNCQLALIEGAGHLPFEETPETFNKLVLDFLESNGVAKTAPENTEISDDGI